MHTWEGCIFIFLKGHTYEKFYLNSFREYWEAIFCTAPFAVVNPPEKLAWISIIVGTVVLNTG